MSLEIMRKRSYVTMAVGVLSAVLLAAGGYAAFHYWLDSPQYAVRRFLNAVDDRDADTATDMFDFGAVADSVLVETKKQFADSPQVFEALRDKTMVEMRKEMFKSIAEGDNKGNDFSHFKDAEIIRVDADTAYVIPRQGMGAKIVLKRTPVLGAWKFSGVVDWLEYAEQKKTEIGSKIRATQENPDPEQPQE